MKGRKERQETIRWIVRNKSVRTQNDLVDELHARGYSVTQATASRDIADMGLRKLPEGIYVLAEDLHLRRMASEFVRSVERIDNFVVIKTHSGTASGVAAAIDATNLADVAGTIAGSDTVLAIARSAEAAETTAMLLELLKSDDAGR